MRIRVTFELEYPDGGALGIAELALGALFYVRGREPYGPEQPRSYYHPRNAEIVYVRKVEETKSVANPAEG